MRVIREEHAKLLVAHGPPVGTVVYFIGRDGHSVLFTLADGQTSSLGSVRSLAEVRETMRQNGYAIIFDNLDEPTPASVEAVGREGQTITVITDEVLRPAEGPHLVTRNVVMPASMQSEMVGALIRDHLQRQIVHATKEFHTLTRSYAQGDDTGALLHALENAHRALVLLQEELTLLSDPSDTPEAP